MPFSPPYEVRHTFIHIKEQDVGDDAIVGKTQSESLILLRAQNDRRRQSSGSDLEGPPCSGENLVCKILTGDTSCSPLSSTGEINPTFSAQEIDLTFSAQETEDAVAVHPASVQRKGYTTIMLRNLPNDYSRDTLAEMLDENGFAGCYDFVYLPVDFKRCAGYGYAFVNMTSVDEVARIRKQMEGHSSWKVRSHKVMHIGFSDTVQGLEACVERYRNSLVMCESLPDLFKPAVYQNGVRVPFPKPNKGTATSHTWNLNVVSPHSNKASKRAQLRRMQGEAMAGRPRPVPPRSCETQRVREDGLSSRLHGRGAGVAIPFFAAML